MRDDAAGYPKERIAVCLAIEERSRVWTEELVEHLRRRYAGQFGIFTTAWHPAGIAVSMVISLLIIPPPNHSSWARVRFAAEWLAMPIILCAFVCWPAIDAQTRLIFRRYMGFRVTVKNGLAQAHEIH